MCMCVYTQTHIDIHICMYISNNYTYYKGRHGPTHLLKHPHCCRGRRQLVSFDGVCRVF